MTVVKDGDDLARSLTATQVTVQVRLGVFQIHEALVQSVEEASNLRLGFLPKIRQSYSM